MESTLRRTWAVIDLDALGENYEKLRRHIGPDVKFLGVVKADAYGHGAIRVAEVLEKRGADYLAVSSIDEAMELRLGGIAMPILILGHTPKEQVEKLIAIYTAKTDHPVHINSVVDPTVMGGMRIQVGDEVTDNTVVAQLQHLQRTVKATA